MGAPSTAMDGVYHDQSKQIGMGEPSINDMMQVIANRDGVAQNNDPGSLQANASYRDPNWLRDNMNNEELLLEFLDDPHNNLED